MNDSLPQVGYGTVTALLVFIVASMIIGELANRAMRRGSFLKGFFLGNRGLGAWALALTATVQSGGTFMGFPSLVYSHGWILSLWIAGYMVVPITGFGILGKRIADLSRRTGAITVPDLFRARFGSPALGLIASFFIMFYMSAMMIAQFKAGALVMKLAWPGAGTFAPTGEMVGSVDTAYLVGLAIFTVTVVGYTLLGGFLAAVWTDLFQSVMMFVGVVILLVLALKATGGLEAATLEAARQTGSSFVYGPGFVPDNPEWRFLPMGLAFSFFAIWVFAGLGSPAGTVRIMACKSTATIRRSIYLLAAYNLVIYIPLIAICICGRALIPDLPQGQTDQIIPRLAINLTQDLPGGSFLAGLILAAPFGAVMATVSSYLVVIASGLVRDIYQRFLNTDATDRQLRWWSTAVMIVVGGVAVAANIKPVPYLQAVVVFSGTGAAATFLVPLFFIAFWRRATVAGSLAAMLSGTGVMIALYVMGTFSEALGLPQQAISYAKGLRPYYLLEIDPFIWGTGVSLVAGIVVSLMTAPPREPVVSALFDAEPDQETLKEIRADAIDSRLSESL